ncbi:hypothetical protein DFJ73DRAFT_394194 [Zopfochytrium polystomum]|nr:hypothetical protein DFJ73DRAFT_394194 [Zopfochytrium polystomum]
MERLRAQAAVERLAEEVLTDRQLVVDYDRRRNENREALGAFRRKEVETGRVWCLVGGVMMKMEHSSVVSMITEEQSRLDGEIDQLRESIRSKTTQLTQMEQEIRESALAAEKSLEDSQDKQSVERQEGQCQRGHEGFQPEATVSKRAVWDDWEVMREICCINVKSGSRYTLVVR